MSPLFKFPNLYFEHYRRRLVTERMTIADAFAMLQEAFNKAEIDREEFLRLLDMEVPEQMVNSPGGTA